jgi:hypothetical protein
MIMRPQLVRSDSAWNPAGLRSDSARCPLYPTRPDPTRPVLKYLRLLVVICLWSSLIFNSQLANARDLMIKNSEERT